MNFRHSHVKFALNQNNIGALYIDTWEPKGAINADNSLSFYINLNIILNNHCLDRMDQQ